MRHFYPPIESDICHGLVEGKVYEDVHRERIRAHDKHDAGGASMERKDWDDPSWLSVLVEEVGEVARELCEQRHHPDVERSEAAGRLRDELIQVAAMACAWADAVDQEAPEGL